MRVNLGIPRSEVRVRINSTLTLTLSLLGRGDRGTDSEGTDGIDIPGESCYKLPNQLNKGCEEKEYAPDRRSREQRQVRRLPVRRRRMVLRAAG